ncbi:MAG TPA: MFS transporter [Candidatus Limnocylindrales bacterium]|nr:MFS transporter [Candidatus Limnocylindrales bacterium]
MWLLELGGLVSMAGTGLILPFLIIYLHDVRGMSLTMAGVATAANYLASLPAGAIGGAWVDRLGPKKIIVLSLLVQAAVISCFPLIREPWHAIALQVAMGLGNGIFWPAQASMLSQLAAQERRPAAFALQRMGMNLGIGIGALAGGAIADVSQASTFTTLFLLDGLSFVAFAAVMAALPSLPGNADAVEGASYGAVLRDRPFLGLMVLNTMLIAAGIVPLVEFLPVYAKHGAAVTEEAIGWIFFANTMAIVVAQLPIAHWLEGKRRMPALAGMAAMWAAMWLVVPLAVENLSAMPAALVLAAVAALLGLGECLLGPVQAPLVADLAGPSRLGRYMAVSSMTWQLGFVIGPPIAGYVLDVWPVALWLGMAAACALSAAGAMWLESAVPESYRRSPA